MPQPGFAARLVLTPDGFRGPKRLDGRSLLNRPATGDVGTGSGAARIAGLLSRAATLH